MKKPGVTLIEVLMYLALSVFLSSMCAKAVVMTIKKNSTSSLRTQAILRLHGVCDLLNRDLAQASRSRTRWKKISPASAVWQVGNHDIGWEYEKGRLVRIVGHYNAFSDSWSERKAALASQDLTNFEMQWVSKSEQMEMVVYTLKTALSDGESPLEQTGTILLLNGMSV